MPVEVVVALTIAAGGVVAAAIAGVFSVITARSGRALNSNTTELAAISAKAMYLVDYYKELAEGADKRSAAKDRTIATQRETIDTLLKRQDILRRAAQGDE